MFILNIVIHQLRRHLEDPLCSQLTCTTRGTTHVGHLHRLHRGKYTSLNLCSPVNLFSYAVTYYKLIKYAFVNKDENIFSLYLILPEFAFQLSLLRTSKGLL